jgi:cell division protein FtsA
MDSSGKIDVLGTATVATRGLKKGRVINSKKVSACVRDAIEKLQKMCGIKIRRVYANMDNPDLKAKLCQENIFLGENNRVRKSHINKLLNSVTASGVSLDRRVIHTGFRNFILDNRTSCINPEGRSASELKLNIITVSSLIPTIKNFVKCIRGAGLILENALPSGPAQAFSLFRNKEPLNNREDILVDAGGGLTKITLLQNKLVRDMIILPLGAQSITEDIAVKLKLSFDCAEQLKTTYGRLHFLEDNFSGRRIIVKDKGTSRIVQAMQLYEIIAPKVDYLLQEIKKALLELDYRNKKIGRLVITGGASVMEGFLERAEEVLEKQVKMGFLSSVKDSRIQAHSAAYATNIGLIHFALTRRTLHSRPRLRNFDPFIRIANQAKHLYREYF